MKKIEGKWVDNVFYPEVDTESNATEDKINMIENLEYLLEDVDAMEYFEGKDNNAIIASLILADLANLIDKCRSYDHNDDTFPSDSER